MTDAARVAVIGAGPGGLVTARWLLAQGLEPTVFEQGPMLGGQWAGRVGSSGVWPTMHTNTSRILTAFSDLAPDTNIVFPSRRFIFDYLTRYAEVTDVASRIRFDSEVTRVSRAETGWLVHHAGELEHFDRVVVATGRFRTPSRPTVRGLDSFTGAAGVHSTFDYRDPECYRGARVLVAGGAISALEIASELAQLGAARVVLTQRRQRYVLPKFAAGVPSDHRMFTRYGALAAACLAQAEIGRQLKELVVEAGGSPEQYGAPAPDPSLLVAGVTLSQHYLPLVAEGRITPRPWITSVRGDAVEFADGSTERFDGILLGTGFDLDVPVLDDALRAVLDIDRVHMDTDRHTFHPDLPGLAFVGMWDQSGGYFVPLELQARWIAYTWAGTIPAPTEQEQRAAIAAYRARRGTPQKARMNLVALDFARAARVEPTLERWPRLHRGLLFGPLAPSSFRLEGTDAVPDAATRFTRDAAAFGAITSNELTARETEQLLLLNAP
jgi:dimethylaniline monooxygenase (N-oxide forming)